MDAALESMELLSCMDEDEQWDGESECDAVAEQSQGMLPPSKRDKKNMCEACVIKYIVIEWAKPKFKGPLCNGCNTLRLLRVPWLLPDQLLIFLSEDGRRQWWISLRTGDATLATMQVPTTKEQVCKVVTNRLRIVGNEEVYVPSENFNQRVKVENLDKVTYMGKTCLLYTSPSPRD